MSSTTIIGGAAALLLLVGLVVAWELDREVRRLLVARRARRRGGYLWP